MNARLRPIIALLLLLSFALALPSVHGQQLMVHSGDNAATAASATTETRPSPEAAFAAQPSAPCHSTEATDSNAAAHADNAGCGGCGDGNCQCLMITLSPPHTPLLPLHLKPLPSLNANNAATAPRLGQLRHPWRPPSNNA